MDEITISKEEAPALCEYVCYTEKVTENEIYSIVTDYSLKSIDKSKPKGSEIMKMVKEVKSNEDDEKIHILDTGSVLVLAAINRVKPEDIQAETLELKTPEGRPYILHTMISKSRQYYNTLSEEEKDIFRDSGHKIPLDCQKHLTWQLSATEKKVFMAVIGSTNRFTADELAATTDLPINEIYKCVNALTRLNDIDEFGEADGYMDAIPRYGIRLSPENPE